LEGAGTITGGISVMNEESWNLFRTFNLSLFVWPVGSVSGWWLAGDSGNNNNLIITLVIAATQTRVVEVAFLSIKLPPQLRFKVILS
jgi:hypothetical protein